VVASIEDPYELPIASVDTLGGVKIGSGIDITDGIISVASGGDGDVTGPETTTENKVPQWDSTNKALKDGVTIGTAANNLVQLDAEGKLPAVDGSNLTNVSTVASFTDLTDCPATLGTVGQVPVVNEAGDALEFATITTTDKFVSVSSNDTTAGYLLGKIVAGAGINVTVQNAEGNETLELSAPVAVYSDGDANVTLPENPIKGQIFEYVGTGTIWLITANTGQQIRYLSETGNTITAGHGYACCMLIFLDDANKTWSVKNVTGLIDITTEGS
jgi:hypothetical protein